MIIPALLCFAAMLITIYGCVLNVQRKWQAFLLWEIANVCMLTYNVIAGDWVQFSYFIVLTVISGWGLWDRLRSINVDRTQLTQ